MVKQVLTTTNVEELSDASRVISKSTNIGSPFTRAPRFLFDEGSQSGLAGSNLSTTTTSLSQASSELPTVERVATTSSLNTPMTATDLNAGVATNNLASTSTTTQYGYGDYSRMYNEYYGIKGHMFTHQELSDMFRHKGWYSHGGQLLQGANKAKNII
ncbi:hypothetical protein SAMD00019534_028710 [Acytostelium subglobosum LB1]|uniref:hypothetical protein n=1 Tax=Acytostelium subglobosum LB1 TaxID=1410327 RepID=UPI000644D1B5|nr:hypothetical protein SAMD00019534_028710 [Acytostelium subglobosum LB1]GAM19696.1 hypothetical protein SAMD00019534_028710 [Acytostelium subglobosum LB1]|eukprot:XP_012756458.1 hypothetical protein SAMD00019534_028710 [Acytostelium subglobosum LB1]